MGSELIRCGDDYVIRQTTCGVCTEIFRCPCDDTASLRSFLEESRIFLGFENDSTEDLRYRKGYLGYYRMRYRGRWGGNWVEKSRLLSRRSVAGVQEIVSYMNEYFPGGFGPDLEQFLAGFAEWRDNEYRLRPVMSDHYVVVINKAFVRYDYPIRIYVYSV